MQFLAVEEQLNVIKRGVEKIVPEEELADRLQESRVTDTPLRIKYGIDPTGIDVHLGHTVPLRKMRQFQDLGHQAVIIIGNYTALVGDPSGRDETRARLTQEQVEANAKDYLEQVGKVVDLDKAEIVHNGDWFGKMSFLDILELCSKVTLAQLLTRDDFSKRFKAESPIYLHECLYPVMQAWDSVKVKADIELGGTEQLYSFMLARDFQRDQEVRTQIGVMSPILVGTDGHRRMGKSLDNYIGISEAPYEMMKKFMQLPDDCMKIYYELLTDMPLDEVDKLLSGHPKEAKLTLARTVITDYHDASSAKEAANRWQREISEKEMPADIPEVKVKKDRVKKGIWIVKLLSKELGLASSGNQARTFVNQGSVWFNERSNRKTDLDEEVEVKDGMIVGVGKKKIVKVKLVD